MPYRSFSSCPWRGWTQSYGKLRRGPLWLSLGVLRPVAPFFWKVYHFSAWLPQSLAYVSSPADTLNFLGLLPKTVYAHAILFAWAVFWTCVLILVRTPFNASSLVLQGRAPRYSLCRTPGWLLSDVVCTRSHQNNARNCNSFRVSSFWFATWRFCWIHLIAICTV